MLRYPLPILYCLNQLLGQTIQVNHRGYYMFNAMKRINGILLYILIVEGTIAFIALIADDFGFIGPIKAIIQSIVQ